MIVKNCRVWKGDLSKIHLKREDIVSTGDWYHPRFHVHQRTDVHTKEAWANLIFCLPLLETVSILQWLGFWHLTFKWKQVRSWLIFFGHPLNYWENQWLWPCYLLLWYGAQVELLILTAKFDFLSFMSGTFGW